MLTKQDTETGGIAFPADAAQDRDTLNRRPSWRRPVVTRIDVGRATLVCASCNPC